MSLHRTVNRLHSDISAVRGGGGRAQEICGVLRAGSTGLILPRLAPDNGTVDLLHFLNLVVHFRVLSSLALLSSAGVTYPGLNVTGGRGKSFDEKQASS